MKKSLTPLGETEMEILHHVWKLKNATVAEVQEQIMKKRKVAYTTVMTIMKNLADKGYLTYEKQGVTYVYSPAKDEQEVKHSLLHGLLNKVFKGSHAELVQTLVKYEKLTDAEREELKKLIENME
jgi:predicted transcriptional regulator